MNDDVRHCLFTLLESQAARRPAAVALVCGNDELSYEQLNSRANQLARFLISQAGVRPGMLVALCAQRSLEQVVAIFAILKAGGAYVPLSPTYPRERQAFMLRDCAAPLLLVQQKLCAGLPEFAGTTLCLEEISPQLAGYEVGNPDVGVSETDVAYVIYTSGSTGTPKGVLVEHRGTYNTAVAHIELCGVRPDDRLLQFAVFSFDTSILEMLMALGAGATLILVPQDQLLVGESLARLIARSAVTMATLQPSVIAALPELPLPSLRTLISAGEACTAALVNRWSGQLALWNAYGPTEGSVCVTLGLCTPQSGPPSIGSPLPNTCVYILDEQHQPVAPGASGEIYIGGVAVARGYLNRPELTAERFLADPWSAISGARMYRTGDLGRWHTDGQVDFLGRIDHQVKLRGFRIELGEIEAALLSQSAVSQCVVLMREDEPGDKRLVAYVVPRAGAEIEIGALREVLRARLPEFMIPSAFVTLATLPLTPHGKVDRAALPQPGHTRPASSEAYIAPRTDIERALAAIFAAVLRIDEVGIGDDFFELGGHSLRAAQVMAQIAAQLKVELPLRALFAFPSIAALAAHIAAQGQQVAAAPLVARADRSRPLSLSASQQQVWLTSQLEDACRLYNEPYAVTLSGPLSADALAEALAALVARHEILRTAFVVVDGVPTQQVHAAVAVAISRADLTELDSSARPVALRRLHDELAARPFDLRTPPLLRALLVRLAEDEHRLLLTIHHALFDGVSLSNVLLPELALLYRAAAAAERMVLPPLDLQYADYTAWAQQHFTTATLAPQLDYWRHQLAELPALQLPTDYPRPAGGSFRGARHPILLKPELTDGLAALAQREGATLYMALLAAFATLLHRYTGQDDLAIAGVISTQTRPEFSRLIGPFVNTVVLRAHLNQEPTFVELLGRMRETVLSAVENQDLPFARLVEALRPERRLGQHPLFQVLFLLDPPGPELPAGWSVSRFEAHNGTAMCDLSLQLDRRPEGLLGFFEYSTELFAPATIARWASHLEVLIHDILVHPTAAIGELTLLPESERTQIASWSGGTSQFPVSMGLHDLFAAQVERTPAAIALTCEQTQLSYRELDQRASRLARRLQTLGVGPDTLVGLCTERSAELIIGILGILKAGGAYVPLDPVYPRERLSFLLADTGVSVLVTHAKVQRLLPPTWTGTVVAIDELLTQDGQLALGDAPQEPLVRSAVRPEHLAYVIYTSGSTGKPKGVQVTHGNVVRLFLATDPWFHFTASDVWCLFHSFAFDFSVWELWGALLTGGRLVVVPYWVSRSAEAFYRLLVSESVTVLNQTPSAFYQLSQTEQLLPAATQPPLSLRLIIFGGEALDLGALLPWFDRHGDQHPQLVNMYGITETTVHVTYYPIVRADCERPGSVIGVPIPDLQTRVLDRRLQPTPIGIPGELFVGGAGVARGYLNRREITAQRFVRDVSGQPNHRLYRSGDWVRYRADGKLEYLGRIDQQIKIRGFRIELGEIEEAIGQHPELQAAVVLLREDTPSDKRLVAYVVPKVSPADPSLTSRIRSAVEQKLPSYMVPSHIMSLAELPLTHNGKVDRRALPAPDRARPSLRAEYLAPRTFVEEELATIFAEVLGVEQVGVHDNFFELGGHSLLVIRVIFCVRDVFHIELPMRAVFEAPTIAGLARHLETLQPGHRGLEVPAIVPTRREGRLPLSFGQQRLWFLGQLMPDAPSYNEPVTIRFRSAIDTAALFRALDEILRRHESWRTTFQSVNGEPFQIIHPPSALDLPIVDLRSLPPEVREAEFLALCTSEAHRPFHLVEGPLVRFLVLILGDEDTRLFITFHHVVADGLSIYNVFAVELSQLYRAFVTGAASPFPELPVQYADFTLWQRRWLRSEVVERQLAYWQKQLGKNLPELQLPTDHAPPPQPAFRGARELVALPLELTQKLRRLGYREGATLFITLLTALKALFHRYITQPDVVIGIVTAGRQRPELAPLLGFFPNTLVLRTEMSGDPSFRALLRRVREVTLQAFDNQDVPFERVVEALNPARRPGEMPLFRVGFILDPLTPELGNSWSLSSTEVEIGAAKFDLGLELVEVPHGVTGRISYRTELFEPATIQRMARHYVALLTSAADQADEPLSRMNLLSAAELSQLHTWSAPVAAFPDGKLAHELFAAQVDTHPDAPALRYQDQVWSYRRLDEAANRVAHALIRRGVKPDHIVALCTERSPLFLVGMLGILKAGGAFLPLDPAYPRDRLQFMLGDAGVEILLTEKPFLAQLPDPSRETLLLDDLAWRASSLSTRPGSTAGCRNLAYVIYTSGSTGRPKGVLIEHRSLVNAIVAQAQVFGITSADRILQFASPGFDIAVFESMLALLSGATLVLAPRAALLPGPELLAVLIEQDVSVLAITASALAVLPTAPLPALQTLIVGGEVLPQELAERWSGLGKTRRVYNAYGPTETTICVTLGQCWSQLGAPPIGRPLTNTQVYVLDAQLQPVPIGIAGEICIGGVGLARGYLGRPELNAERFIQSPFSPTERLYRTGDLGRWRSDGQLDFLGRLDTQVKVRGYRIELGEIESVLSTLPHLREAAVIVRSDGSERHLVAYVVPDEPIPTVAVLRLQLAALLPPHMIPMAIVVVPELPRTPNGKTDRRTLEQTALQLQPAESEYRPPESDLEQSLATIWQDVLRVERVGMHDNFFDLGGHSLRMAQVHARLREVLGRDVPLLTFFQYPTIHALAAFLQGEKATDKLSSSQERGRLRKEAAAMQRRRMTERKKRDE